MRLLLMYAGFFFRSAQCANILCVFPFPAVSHQSVFQPIWRELSLRGHSVTVVTPDPLNDPALTNLTEISVKHAYEVWKYTKPHTILPRNGNIFQGIVSVYNVTHLIAEAELNTTDFQTLISDKNMKFDLIVVEWAFDVLYALGDKLRAPILAVSSFAMNSVANDYIGNPNHPFLYPHMLCHQGKKISLWQKIINLSFTLWFKFYHNHYVLPEAYTMARTYLDNNMSVNTLTKNVCGVFINTNPIIYPPRPNVPMSFEIGQMSIKPVQPLPKDLKNILDEAHEGVIYFNLGSSFQTVDLDENTRRMITEALAELPYKVLWKWESNHLPGKPSNVETRQWFPQQDVLAHPNIRAFVTQGGLQSLEEAISSMVPIVGLPLMGEQAGNVQKIVDLGMGIGLNLATFTKEELKRSIIEVCENNFYKQRMKRVRSLIYDKPVKDLEQVIWWSEYFIRHKNVKHLRSPRADMFWIHYLMVDVALTFLILVFCLIYGGCSIINWC